MKRILFYLIGLFTIAFGASGVILSDMGAGAWDADNVGLSENIGLTIGNWMIIVGFIILVFNKFLAGKKIDVFAFLTVFLLGLMIDFWLLIVFSGVELQNLGSQILFFVFGFAIMCLGAGTYLQADFAPTPIDSLMLAVSQRFKLSIGTARLACEIVATLLGLLVGGPISFGTVVIALFIGYGVQGAVKFMSHFYQPELNKAPVKRRS